MVLKKIIDCININKVFIMTFVIFSGAFFFHYQYIPTYIDIEMQTDEYSLGEVFYYQEAFGGEYSGRLRLTYSVYGSDSFKKYHLKIPRGNYQSFFLRLDPNLGESPFTIRSLSIYNSVFEMNLSGGQIYKKIVAMQQVDLYQQEDVLFGMPTGSDPHFHLAEIEVPNLLPNNIRLIVFLAIIIFCILMQLLSVKFVKGNPDTLKDLKDLLYENKRKLIYVIVGLFFLKTLFLAFFVTPLWDLPDEPGHYSYIKDLEEGRGLPVRGEALMTEKVLDSWYTKTPRPEQQMNWIAQHPPAYHLVGATSVRVAKIFTDDSYWLFRAPRIITSISGALALLVFYLIFRLISGSITFALSTTAVVSFIPMYSHMSSGTNHDIFFTLVSALSILFWCRYLIYGNNIDALYMAVFLALAGFTKTTMFAFAVPMIALLFFHMKKGFIKRIAFTGFIGLISFSLPVYWLLRNWLQFNVSLYPLSLFTNNGGNYFLEKQASIGILEFMKTEMVLENTLRHFFALIGWSGVGGGRVITITLDGIFLSFYTLTVFFFAGFAYYYYFARSIKNDDKYYQFIAIISIITLIGSFIFIYYNKPYPLYQQLLFSFLLATLPFCFLSLTSSSLSKIDHGKMFYYSLGILFFFLIAYIITLFRAFEIHGRLRADHGRYWFPVIPFLGISFLIPAYKLLRPHQLILLLLIITFAFVELFFFLVKVDQFYYIGLF